MAQGASNTPAWLVAKGNQYARDHGRPPFVIYQGEWNVVCRDVGRDILPLCRNDGAWDCTSHPDPSTHSNS